ncbi:unnamed protein product [Nesidiocoris tenuis]|uniref:Uncharacterized protein n=1 Tax=Nesidiocoris tenuis TaxID=355587 RepID=A0A6H5GG31_9HEMI|nr:unnamed protein product [Nesidiocoris tenuis]
MPRSKHSYGLKSALETASVKYYPPNPYNPANEEAPHFAKEDEPVTPIIRAKKFTELRPRQDRTRIGIESGFMLWGAHRQCTSSNPSLTYFNPSMHPPLRSAVNAANGFDWQFFPHRRSSSFICRTESCYTYLYYIEMKMVLIVKGAISDTRWTESHGTGHPNHVYPDAMVATGQSQLRRFQRHSINRNQGFTADGGRFGLLFLFRLNSPSVKLVEDFGEKSGYRMCYRNSGGLTKMEIRGFTTSLSICEIFHRLLKNKIK